MKTEIIAVGTELLLGQIVDTNSSWMGEQLALAGIDSHYQTKVGDNFDRIDASLRLALDRSEAVIVCGGLGPTQDDITRDVLASVMGVDLVLDERIAERIRSMFSSRSRPMPENNLRQAMVPVGASPIPQQPGTAPGLVAPIRWMPGIGALRPGVQPPRGAEALDRVVYAVPGVPYEMREMLQGTVLADLQRRAGVSAAIESRVLRTWGQSESGLAEMLAGRIAELDRAANPTLAFLASGIEGIKIRITAKGADSTEAWQIIDAEQARLAPLLGDLVFAYDDDTMETAVLAELDRLGLTLAVVETVTGGRMANRLSSADAAMQAGRPLGGTKLGDAGLAVSPVGEPSTPAGPPTPAGSRRFAGGIVACSAQLAEQLLEDGSTQMSPLVGDVPSGVLQQRSASETGSARRPASPAPRLASLQGAQALARAARLRTGAGVGLAVTAVDQRESATPEHPYGTAFLAVSISSRTASGNASSVTPREQAEQIRLPGDRERLADYSAISALNLLRLMLAGRR
ncbi:molybdopterin-binding protein [Candidatus Poriferisodalis sp.]|uniref:molybdopterin-binding protein n=1 Tax=Candidatus Poriferisodalis sp. TaxID=3101277 RepID=UPI003B0210EE